MKLLVFRTYQRLSGKHFGKNYLVFISDSMQSDSWLLRRQCVKIPQLMRVLFLVILLTFASKKHAFKSWELSADDTAPEQSWRDIEVEHRTAPINFNLPAIENASFPRLRVKFYVYENGLNWENATIMSESVGTFKYPKGEPLVHFKHSSDYWMLQAALRHPLRTTDPAQAKLFYVPTLMNVLFEMKHSSSRVGMPLNLCVNGTCGFDALMKSANQLLGESPYFQASQGYDHILVSCHSDSDAAYTKSQAFYNGRHRNHLWATSKIIFEDRFRPPIVDADPKRQPHHIPHLYVAHGCPYNSTTTKEQDLAMIASLHYEQTNSVVKARFKPRRDLCEWLSPQNATTMNTLNYSMAICGEGNQCPALSQARYGFHVAGDTLGANRLQDTILSGTVPIFTDLQQYNILPSFIPWRDLSEHVTLKSEEDFRHSLAAILQQPSHVYKTKRQMVLFYSPALDLVHSSHVAFDWYMTEFAERMGYQ